ncbi:MAG: methyltransferase [Planctomycetota bacterium]
MNPLTTAPQTDPTLLLRYRDRQYAADLLGVAILRFNLFTWLDGRSEVETAEILRQFDVHRRPTEVLLTLCRSMGLMESDASLQRHRLTQLGREHLVDGSPWSLKPYYQSLESSSILQDHLKVLKTGRPGNWQAQSDGNDWHESMRDPEFASRFTAMMNCRGLSFGQALAKKLGPELKQRKHVLDVGGGSGIYSATLVATHDHLHATVLEQAPVDQLVEKEVVRHGLQSRISVASGDMFDCDWPQEVDVVLMSNLLHDWDLPQIDQLLQRADETLPAGGLLVVHQALLDDDLAGPLPAAEYSCLLMNITQGRCYSRKEIADLLVPRGYQIGECQETLADRRFFTATKR